MVSETEDLSGFICSVTECLFWHSAPRVHPGTPIALVPLDPCILELGGTSSKLVSFLDLIYIQIFLHIYFWKAGVRLYCSTLLKESQFFYNVLRIRGKCELLVSLSLR